MLSTSLVEHGGVTIYSDGGGVYLQITFLHELQSGTEMVAGARNVFINNQGLVWLFRPW